MTDPHAAPMPIAEVLPPPAAFNFARHVLALNAERGDRVAYKDDRGELTYGELAGRVVSLAHSLSALGVRRDERMMILMHDCMEWPVAFLGALYGGIVPVPINTLLTPSDIAYVIDHSGATAAIVGASLLGQFEAARAQSRSAFLRLLIVATQGNAAAPGGAGPPARRAEPNPEVVGFDRLIEQGDPRSPGADTHRDSIAFWLYSSGSTGRPKAVVHAHGSLYWTAELYAKRILGIRADDRVFSAAKLFFAYGLGNALTFPLSVGASTVLMSERATPDAVFRRLVNERPTIFCGAPTLYAAMLGSTSLPPRESVRLRACTSAGEALPRELGERFARHFGCDILDGLGSTEMLHIFLSNRPDQLQYGTTGVPVGGYAIELKDEAGRPVEDGHIGDLWVSGPSSALLYWNDIGKSRDTFHGRWVRTGDKYMRAHGYYTYAGRNDDMLKISGQYVSPFEVESTLMEHEAVLEAAVVAITDAVGLCRCKAYVVLRRPVDMPDALVAELQVFVKQRLAPFKRPQYIEFVPELPKTATGKIQRFRLRERNSS